MEKPAALVKIPLQQGSRETMAFSGYPGESVLIIFL
jgi:hypothetical protein